MGKLLNGWYKCTESNEKSNGSNYAWIEGRYYYFKNGRTEDEKGKQRPVCGKPITTGVRVDEEWLNACNLIPAVWDNGCCVKLKDGRTGKITINEGEMIEVQLDNTYAIPSFVKVTPNEFEVITPEAQVFRKMKEQLQHLNESMQKFNGFVVNLKPFTFEIPEVGMNIRDKKTLKVWKVEEVKLPECCCEENPFYGGYAELQLMTTTPATETVWPSCNGVPFAINAKTMLHEIDLEHFWDNYEVYEDLGWCGVYFDLDCNCGKGKFITVCCGQIAPGSYDDGRRFKNFEEIKSHIPNIIEVDSKTYYEQDDPAGDFFTGYALCIRNADEKLEEYCISVGKVYRMNCGRFVNDRGELDTCYPAEFNRCFKPVNESFE